MDGAERLFTQVQDTTFRLTKLADERLHRLEECLQLRQFEEQSSKVSVFSLNNTFACCPSVLLFWK